MIKIENVTKSYTQLNDSKKALDNISFEVNEGEFLSIIGTSGSGKTTLLNVIGGLDTHYEGNVVVFDKKLKTLSDKDLSHYRNSYIGFIFQNFNLLNQLSTEENIKLPYRFSKTHFDARERVKEVLKTVNMSEKIDSFPHQLSGGQRQRVAIARALFNKPKILLCDEPTGNLDRDTGVEVLNFFRKLNQEQKITVLIITHEHHVADMTDRVIHLENGAILKDTKK